MSDPLGQSQIVPYLCGIAKNGYQITILSCEKTDRLEKEKKNILNLIEGLPIAWDYILYDENGGFMSRFSYIKKLEQLAEKVRSKSKIELIHCRSYLSSLIGLKFKLRYKTPFVFDMRGFWADERIDGGIWKKENLLHRLFYNFFKRKEKQFIINANAIVSLTNAAVSELGNKFSSTIINSKTTVIPCCTNTTLFDPANKNVGFTIPGISSSDHVIIYTGSIGTWYYTKEMIDCIITWKQDIPDIKLLIVTKDTVELDKILASYSNEDRALIIKASASYKDVPSYLALAKAAMFFIKPSYSKIASSPTKMAECWSMNLPIITNQGIGDNDLYFNKHKGGILIKEFNISAYRSACLKYQDLLKQNHNFRKIALDFFDTKTAVSRYTAIYNSLTNK